MNYLFFILAGYFSGSILYAYLIPLYVKNINICEISDDGNPGAANAFIHAGIPVGLLAVCLEILKGFFPVFAAVRIVDSAKLPFAFVMAAPVFGHAFSPLFKGNGGKAIAASFGVVLALIPNFYPFAALAFFYILFSTIIVIKPHFFRSILTFFLFTLTVCIKTAEPSVRLGCFLISAITIYKHIIRYHGEKPEVRFLRR